MKLHCTPCLLISLIALLGLAACSPPADVGCEELGATPFAGVAANANQYSSFDVARGALNETAMSYSRYEFYDSVLSPGIQLIREFPKLRVWRNKAWTDIDLNTTVYSGNGGSNILFVNGKIHYFYTSGNSQDPTTFNNYVQIEGAVAGQFSAPFKIGPAYFSQSGEHSVALNAQDGRIGMVVRGKETSAETSIHLFYVEKKADSSSWTSEPIMVGSSILDGGSVYFTYGKDNTAWAVIQEFTSTTTNGLHVLHRVGGSWDDVALDTETSTNRINVPAAVKISNGVSEKLAIVWNDFVGSVQGKLVVNVMGATLDMTQDRLVVPPAQTLLASANSLSLLAIPTLLASTDGSPGYIFAGEIGDQRSWLGRMTDGVFTTMTAYLKDEKVIQPPRGFYAPCGEAQVVLQTGADADRGDLAKTVRIQALPQ